MTRKLFLLRVNAEGQNRMEDYKNGGFIAIGWGKLLDISNNTKKDISNKLTLAGYKVSNTVVGQIYHMVSTMSVGDWCLIPEPDTNNVYLAEIKSNYYFDATEKDFPHKRKVEFINIDSPFDRTDFPEELNKALKPMMTCADVTARYNALIAYMNNEEVELTIEERLNLILPTAINTLEELLNSENEEIKLKAAMFLVDKAIN